MRLNSILFFLLISNINISNGYAQAKTSSAFREMAASCTANYSMDLIENIINVKFTRKERQNNIEIQKKLALKPYGDHPIWCFINYDTPLVKPCVFTPINMAILGDFNGSPTFSGSFARMTYNKLNASLQTGSSLLLPKDAKAERISVYWNGISIGGDMKEDLFFAPDAPDSPGFFLHQIEKIIENPTKNTREVVEDHSVLERRHLIPFMSLSRDLEHRRALNSGSYTGRISLIDERNALTDAGQFQSQELTLDFVHLKTRYMNSDLNLPENIEVPIKKYIRCLQSIR